MDTEVFNPVYLWVVPLHKNGFLSTEPTRFFLALIIEMQQQILRLDFRISFLISSIVTLGLGFMSRKTKGPYFYTLLLPLFSACA